MSRILSALITTEIAKLEVRPRTLYYLELKDKITGNINVLRMTNHETDIIFSSNTYSSYNVKHSNINTYLKNQTDNCTITIDNVDRGMSAYIAASEFSGQRAIVYKVFLDSNNIVIDSSSNPNDSIMLFSGFMNMPKISESKISVRIVNMFDRSQSYTPWRRFMIKCNWRFCASRCTYNDGNGAPRGNVDTGSTGGTLTDVQLIGVSSMIGAYCKMLSGANKNSDRYVGAHNTSTGEITFINSFSNAVSVGDKYLIECDKSMSTCMQYLSISFLLSSGIATANGPNASTILHTSSLAIDTSLRNYTVKIISGPLSGEKAIVTNYASEVSLSISPNVFSGTITNGTAFEIWTKGNHVNFGGFDDGYAPNNKPVGYSASTGTPSRQAVYTTLPSSEFDGVVPIIYGRSVVSGVRISDRYAVWNGVHNGINYYNTFNGEYGTRVYALAEGEIDGVETCVVNGTSLDIIDGSAASGGFSAGIGKAIVYRGTSTQGTKAVGGLYNYRRTALVRLMLWYGSPKSDKGFWNLTRNNSFTPSDEVAVTVRGLRLQEYSPSGTPAILRWSQNPAWAILDFFLNRASTPLEPSQIDFVSFYNAAQTSVINNYKLNLVIAEQKNDNAILDLMLLTCRGYLTYTAGKVELNIEAKWIGVAAHVFDDSTNDNIKKNSFSYSNDDINDRPNRTIVKYVDQEERENLALINIASFLPKASTDIPYDNIHGVFAPSGTIYIGSESITYTGNDGAKFIGAAVRQNDYASGYPIFQGEQTYPERTAFYNDYDSQDLLKRLIEKSFDGSAIPTYRQAYNIAEWKARKAIEGNTQVQLIGLMDALHLTVGDVVEVTHTLPGWTNEEFRVTRASESEDEEISYDLELYDDSFYEDNVQTPATLLVTSLPNPFAAPGDVTDLKLLEDAYMNTDGTYDVTLTLTYFLPNDPLFWEHAIIQIRTTDEPNYRDYGTDKSRGAGYIINSSAGRFKTGQTVYIKVISVNSRGVSGNSVTSPTISVVINKYVTDPDIITGLQLEGATDPMNYVWDGKRFAIRWRGASQTGGAGREPAGNELQGAGGISDDPNWQHDEVEIWTDGALRHSTKTREFRYEYVHGDGYDDFLDNFLVASNGTVALKVRRWNVYNKVSDYTEITVTQASPAAPANLVSIVIYRAARFEWDKSAEADFSHYEGRSKITVGGTFNAWAKLEANRLDRTMTNAEVDTSGITAAIYCEVRAVDLYNNVSTSSSTFAEVLGIRPEDFIAGTIKSQIITLGLVATLGDVALQAGKTDFGQDTTAGFRLGVDDSDSDAIKFEIGGDSGNLLKYSSLTGVLSIRGVLNADDIVAGSINADMIKSGSLRSLSYQMKGSHTTLAIIAGQSTINLYDGSDFPSSGNGWVIGAVDGDDAFTWTGKSGDQLTGCGGLLAAPVDSLVVPAVDNIVISNNSNELTLFGNRGDGVVEQLVKIGRHPLAVWTEAMTVGSTSTTLNTALRVRGAGLRAIYAYGTGSTVGIFATSVTGYGGSFQKGSNSLTDAPIRIVPSLSSAKPTHAALRGAIWPTSDSTLYLNTNNSTAWEAISGTRVDSQGSYAVASLSSVVLASGKYQFAYTEGVILELYVLSSWRSLGVDNSNLDGMVWSDGTNMRLRNLLGVSRVVYYQKF